MLDYLQETKPSSFKKERRRERSRDAARCRRHKESDTFQEITDIVPVSHDLVSNLDRSSVMRLVNSFIKLRQSLTGTKEDPNVAQICNVKVKQEALAGEHVISSEDFANALNGFLFVLSSDLDILYVSDNVKEYLGRSKIELVGQSIISLVHEGDHDEVRHCFQNTNENDTHRTFFLRMKSTLTVGGKSINLKSASYKVLQCSGFRKPAKDDAESGLFVVQAQPIPHPANIEHFLDSKTFLTQHTPDMKFSYCDERIRELLGYDESDLLGRSFFDYCHVLDIKQIDSSFQKLYKINQVETSHYRFLSKTGGYHWLVTQASLIVCPKNQKPQCIVCVHYVISGSMHQEIIYSSEQSSYAQAAAIPFDVIAIENLTTDDEANIEEASEFVLDQDAYLDDLLKPPEPAAKETAASTYGECRIVAPTFAATDESEDLMSDEMYFNAPYIGDPWVDNTMAQEKLEDLFVDVTVENPTPGTNQTPPRYTDEQMFDLSGTNETTVQDNADLRRLCDITSATHPPLPPEAQQFMNADLDKQLGARCGSPGDSAYCGSPDGGTPFCLDEQLRFHDSPPPSVEPERCQRQIFHNVVLSDQDYDEHMSNLQRGFVGTAPGLDGGHVNRKRLHCSNALGKLANPLLPPPTQKRRCFGRASQGAFENCSQSGTLSSPASVEQVVSVLLQPGTGYGFTGESPNQPLRSLFLQKDLFGSNYDSSACDRRVNNLLPELSLHDCEINAPCLDSGKLPLGPDCVHALDEVYSTT